MKFTRQRFQRGTLRKVALANDKWAWEYRNTAPVQQDYIRPAGCCLVACPKCGAGEGIWCLTDSPTPNGKRLLIHKGRKTDAGKYAMIGWHTFRHTYRTWLDETGAPVGVQQKLMRHAQVSTTMNIYGNALMNAKRRRTARWSEEHCGAYSHAKEPANTAQPTEHFSRFCFGGLFWVGLRPKWLRGQDLNLRPLGYA